MHDESEPLDLARLTTLADAVVEARNRPRGWSVFFPIGAERLAPTTPCLWVFDLYEDVEADAAAAGWRPGLSAADLRGVHDNLKQQVSGLTADQLASAVEHYFRNDAFIRLDR